MAAPTRVEGASHGAPRVHRSRVAADVRARRWPARRSAPVQATQGPTHWSAARRVALGSRRTLPPSDNCGSFVTPWRLAPPDGSGLTIGGANSRRRLGGSAGYLVYRVVESGCLASQPRQLREQMQLQGRLPTESQIRPNAGARAPPAVRVAKVPSRRRWKGDGVRKPHHPAQAPRDQRGLRGVKAKYQHERRDDGVRGRVVRRSTPA